MLADIVLAAHFAVVLFVMGGLVAIVVGNCYGWLGIRCSAWPSSRRGGDSRRSLALSDVRCGERSTLRSWARLLGDDEAVAHQREAIEPLERESAAV